MSTIVALSVAVIATLVRGYVGISIVAGLVISVAIVAFGAGALASSRKAMRRFSIGLGVYGSAFVLQAVLLTSYVGSRTIDIAWGSLIVAIGAFLFRSQSLEHYYFESEQGLGVKNMGANSNSSDA